MNQIELCLGLSFLLVLACRFVSVTAQDVLVVEQDYTAVSAQNQEIAKNIRQILYLSASWIRIDEFEHGTERPSTSLIVDLQGRVIATLTPTPDGVGFQKTIESFEDRRARIRQRAEKLKADLNSMDKARREQFQREHRAAFEETAQFELQKGTEKDAKRIANTNSVPVSVIDRANRNFVALKVYPHHEIKLPYGSAEVLYLLQIVGPKMEVFLREYKSEFQFLPLEMDLELASGGRLSLIVKNVKQVNRSDLKADLHSYAQYPNKPIHRQTGESAKPD